MKRCEVKPYTGEEEYIYISYLQKDKKHIFPIIERLSRDGYRVWYNEETDLGTDWPEAIASRLNKCSVCLVFITENSIHSHNCRREINFALLKQKLLIAVMLEPVILSLGMEMQLSAVQSIFKYTIEDENSFYDRLYSIDVIDKCKGASNDSISVSSPGDYSESLLDIYGTDERLPFPFGKKMLAEGFPNPCALLIREQNGEEILVMPPEMTLGRDKRLIDYAVESNSAVSRIHAKITYKNKFFYLIDCGSLNKTFLNLDQLVPQQEYLLHEGDVIRFANERFIFSQGGCG